MNEINSASLPFIPAGGIQELRSNRMQYPILEQKSRFAETLENELSKLKFSAHAQHGITSRDLDLKKEDIKMLENAADAAEKKGGNEALILLRDMAFIVNIPNKTVVTAAKKADEELMTFTNITAQS